MGNVVMYGSVSVDGFIADEHDQPGPLLVWLTSGDAPLDASGEPSWKQIDVALVAAGTPSTPRTVGTAPRPAGSTTWSS